MATIHLGPRHVSMPDQVAAEFQEVLARVLGQGRGFMFMYEGDDRYQRSALTVWVHPHLDWHVVYDGEDIPPIHEAVVEQHTAGILASGRLVILREG
ncbi:MAG: hypothetical protein ACOC84_06480 [Actinomycetota bacterium]